MLQAQQHQLAISLDDLPVEPDYMANLVDRAERPDAYIERMELRQQIEVGLRALSPVQRTAIVLCDIHGYSYAEIADIIGVSMGIVKSRYFRGRSRLAGYLREQDLA
jgi:RNA polymerase sigma-70 factor (ECF subfamily)